MLRNLPLLLLSMLAGEVLHSSRGKLEALPTCFTHSVFFMCQEQGLVALVGGRQARLLLVNEELPSRGLVFPANQQQRSKRPPHTVHDHPGPAAHGNNHDVNFFVGPPFFLPNPEPALSSAVTTPTPGKTHTAYAAAGLPDIFTGSHARVRARYPRLRTRFSRRSDQAGRAEPGPATAARRLQPDVFARQAVRWGRVSQPDREQTAVKSFRAKWACRTDFLRLPSLTS